MVDSFASDMVERWEDRGGKQVCECVGLCGCGGVGGGGGWGGGGVSV